MNNIKILEDNKTLVDLVEERLLEFFQKSKMQPGDSIPTEAELMNALGVGRSVIREALSRFRMLGLVQSRTRRGMILSEPDLLGGLNKVIEPSIMSKNNIKEILGLRIALEVGNAYFIINNITDADILELEEIVNNNQASKYNKFSVQGDRLFHSKLHDIGGNKVISRYQEVFYKVFVFTDENFGQYFKKYNEKIPKKRLVTHRDLLSKLKERDVSGFQDLMLKHLTLYIDFINSKEII